MLDRYQLIKLPGDVYQISYLPFRVLPLDFVDRRRRRRCVVCFARDASIPSRQAGTLDPAEALRYE